MERKHTFYGLVKRILPDSNSFSINSIDDIKNLNNESS